MTIDISQIDIALADMEYTADETRANPDHGGYNEYYKGTLPNGDILYVNHYGYYSNRNFWEWEVFIPEDFPIQCYQRNYLSTKSPTAADALADFYKCYKGRHWLSKSEYETIGFSSYRCLECGWEGESHELKSATVIEDYGDVLCLQCPGCGRIEYDGMKLLVEIDD